MSTMLMVHDRPTLVQQLIRSLFYVAQFGAGYMMMLLAMYYNGGIIFAIFVRGSAPRCRRSLTTTPAVGWRFRWSLHVFGEHHSRAVGILSLMSLQWDTVGHNEVVQKDCCC